MFFHGADSRSLQPSRYLCNSLLLEKTVVSPSLLAFFTLFPPFSLAHSRQQSPPPPGLSHRSVLTFSCDKAILYSVHICPTWQDRQDRNTSTRNGFYLNSFLGKNRGTKEGDDLTYSKSNRRIKDKDKCSYISKTHDIEEFSEILTESFIELSADIFVYFHFNIFYSGLILTIYDFVPFATPCIRSSFLATSWIF